MNLAKLKIILEEKVKTHERAKDCLRYNDQEQVEVRIAVYKQILGIIEGPNGECNCSYNSGEHFCPVHGNCESSIPNG